MLEWFCTNSRALAKWLCSLIREKKRKTNTVRVGGWHIETEKWQCSNASNQITAAIENVSIHSSVCNGETYPKCSFPKLWCIFIYFQFAMSSSLANQLTSIWAVFIPVRKCVFHPLILFSYTIFLRTYLQIRTSDVPRTFGTPIVICNNTKLWYLARNGRLKIDFPHFEEGFMSLH